MTYNNEFTTLNETFFIIAIQCWIQIQCSLSFKGKQKYLAILKYFCNTVYTNIVNTNIILY